MPLRSKSTIICPRRSKLSGWLAKHGQISAAKSVWQQQSMPNHTVEQILRANAWFRRAHQFADLQIDIFEHSSRETSIRDTHRRFEGSGRNWTDGGWDIIGATDPSTGAGHVAPWAPQVWKSHKLKQGCTSTLAGEAKALSWDTCNGSCACLPLFCSPFCVRKQRHVHSTTLDTSVPDCKSVFDFRDKTWCSDWDTHCAIDMAIIRGCLRRMGVTFRWGPTGLMLGDALTKDKAEAERRLSGWPRGLSQRCIWPALRS